MTYDGECFIGRTVYRHSRRKSARVMQQVGAGGDFGLPFCCVQWGQVGAQQQILRCNRASGARRRSAGWFRFLARERGLLHSADHMRLPDRRAAALRKSVAREMASAGASASSDGVLA